MMSDLKKILLNVPLINDECTRFYWYCCIFLVGCLHTTPSRDFWQTLFKI